jgi:xyloglucan:xyloglucosyl transferase
MACSFLFLAFLTTAAAACLSAAAATGKLLPPPETPSLSFGEGYTQLFGDSNLALHGGGKRVHISLDERTGGSRLGFAVLFSPECPIDGNGKPCFVLFLLCSLTSSLLCSAPLRTGAGFASQAAYLHGLFSARIKLPADHTAGVVVAFYVREQPPTLHRPLAGTRTNAMFCI